MSLKVEKGLLQGRMGEHRPKGGEGMDVSARDKGAAG